MMMALYALHQVMKEILDLNYNLEILNAMWHIP